MVVKNDKNAEEADYQTSIETKHNAYKWDQEIVPLSCSNDGSAVTNRSDQHKTPESQKMKYSGVAKRWASVVKASKNYQQIADGTSNSDDQIENKCKPSEMIDSVFKLLPTNFQAQKGYIVSRNTLYFCVPCDFELDSVFSIVNHLKTRKHEDSIISYLKGKLPPPLDNIMEYVSFFAFNLCCNLCRGSIAMSSYNPFETIVNIVAHNACQTHIDQKATGNSYNRNLTDITDLVSNENSTMSQKKVRGSNQPDGLEFSDKKTVPENKSLKSTLALNKPLEDTIPENQSTASDKQSRVKDLLSSIPSGLLHIDCIVENDKGSITCLICNRVVPPSSHNLYTHLRGSNHKKNKDKSNANKENKANNKSDSMELEHLKPNNEYKGDFMKKIPTFLRRTKICSSPILTSKEVESHFKTMMTNNPLISENDCYIVRNVDGMNSYCKLCCTLMPLSTNLIELENILIEHFQNLKHVEKVSKTALMRVKQESPVVGSGRVSRSLFSVSKNDIETENDDSKEQDPSVEITQLCAELPQKKENGDAVVTKTATSKPSKGNKVRCINVETEQDEQVLKRRQKQISYGKNTVGYSRYCQLVPKEERKLRNPVTPPRHVKCSRRAWDGMVRSWRIQLHAWDPPQTPTPDDFPWLTALPSD